MKTKSYPDEGELYFARNMVLHAARAAGVAAFDTVFGNVDDEEGFVKGVELIHQLGFDGKSVINQYGVKFLWSTKFMRQRRKKSFRRNKSWRPLKRLNKRVLASFH